MTESVRMGAYHARAWAGLVVSDLPGQGAAFRFLVSRKGERADWRDLTNLIHQVGPCAADGSYARLELDTSRNFTRVSEGERHPITHGRTTCTLEWSRVSDEHLVARGTVDFPGVLELRGYFPWDWTGEWAIDRSDLVARWGPRPSTLLVQVIHRPALGPSERGRALLDPTGEAAIRFNVAAGSRVYVECRLLAGEPDPVRIDPDIDAIDGQIGAARGTYEQVRVATGGAVAGLAEAITNAVNWSVLIQPETGERYVPADREWIFPTPAGEPEPWMTFSWDSFWNAMQLGLESPDLAREAIRVSLEAQYPSGNVPNWRGREGGSPDRSQPPLGSYAVLRHVLRTGDHELLEWAMPILQRWNAWWYAPKGSVRRRDGNANGLFNWGCDTAMQPPDAPLWERDLPPSSYAAFESGLPDLPHWDGAPWSETSETMALDAVDLNSYLALDFECLAGIAAQLGDADKEMWYLEQYRALKRRIDETLWDEETGVYRDRYWDGRMSPHLGATNFLPLIAGIPGPERARRMVRVLTDSRRLWGRYVVRAAEPAADPLTPGRTSIRPPLNYLIYHGLRRYELDREAAELAARSVDMFRSSWQQFQCSFERFNPADGTGGGRPYHGTGMLMGLMGIEEFLDITPWHGLRIGSPTSGAQRTISRLGLFGQEWTVTLAKEGLTVAANGVTVLHTDRPLVLRDVTFEAAGFAARCATEDGVTITLDAMRGPVRCDMNGDVTALEEPTLALPPGSHRFRIWSDG